MPEKEFELYLSLLVKLLRLSPDQKTSIERELRDHFEERFEALVRQGMPRDEAIRRTLDEFGDVAGLASEFTHLSRKHIRRRIMQGTMATAGVAAAIVIYVTLFRGPDPAVGPGPNVVAQDNAGIASLTETQASDATTDHGPGNVADVVWIDPGQFMPERLAQPIDVDFREAPLEQVIAHIAREASVNFVLDHTALTENGLHGQELISVSVKGVPAYAVLNQILSHVDGVELSWVNEDGVISITTSDDAESVITTRYHNVRDLLDAGYTHDRLSRFIAHFTSGPWESTDGIGGVISQFGDLLIVRSYDRVHPEVDCVLAALRNRSPIRWIGEPEAHALLYAALDDKAELTLAGGTLRDAIRSLSEQHQIPLALDDVPLADEGITGDEVVTINVSGIKLRSLLTLILDSVGDFEFDFIARDGTLWLTTKDVADSTISVVIYDVADITGDNPDQMERLISVVMDQTEGPWEQIDGVGGTTVTIMPGTFACLQTPRTQAEVPIVLDTLRQSLAVSSGDRKYLLETLEEPTKLETRFYRMDSAAAVDVARLIPSVIETSSWKPVVDDGGGSGFGGVAKPEPNQVGTIRRIAAGRMLLQLDTGALADPQGDSTPNAGDSQAEPSEAEELNTSESNVIVVPQSILIVTHKPAVQRKIKQLLTSLLSEKSIWTGERGGKVRFVAPGFQEGQWPDLSDPVRGSDLPVLKQSGGFGGGGFFSVDSREQERSATGSFARAGPRMEFE